MKKKIVLIIIICVIMITTVSLGTMIVQKRYNEIGEIADNGIVELEDSNNTNTTNETVNENNVIENNTVEEQKEIIQETNENENNNHKEKTIAKLLGDPNIDDYDSIFNLGSKVG